MGHLGHLKEEYRALVHRLEAGTTALPEPKDPRAWQGWKEILEILYTPEEAALASRMPTMPTGLTELTRILGVSAEELGPKLDGFCDRGLVLDLRNPKTGATKYMLAPSIVGFIEFSLMRAHDSIPKKRMAEALEAYCFGDDTIMREVFSTETTIGRALVHETALGDELPDVLDWESATSLIADAHTCAVALCYCRHKAEHLGHQCDAPMEACLSLNAGAEFIARRGFGRAIEKSEALDILVRSREHGLVQIADNVLQRPTFICNCCGCCCGQLQSINHFHLQGVNPSGFLASSDDKKCAGCSKCARACPVGAITMEPVRAAAKRKNEMRPVVDREICIGCGVCVGACKKDAMAMQRRPVRPHVPENTIEKSVRQVLERGRLSHLLFDEGLGRGPRFLNGVVQVLQKLPMAQRVIASEQVQSRFVKAALGMVKDPTAP